MAETGESIGRIEVAPEVLTTIVQFATLRVEGVHKLVPATTGKSRFSRRSVHQNGIVLDLSDDKLIFDIYVIMDPHVNIMQTSRNLQKAVIESIDNMVGIPVDAVNVHVEDVIYAQDETV